MNTSHTIAYFSMEIGLDPAIPTYSGGLGILAGDTLRAAADLGTPLVGVTLLYRRGYFRQELTNDGLQIEHAIDWNPAAHLELLPTRITMMLSGRPVQIQAWRYLARGLGDHVVPVYLLDTDCDANHPDDRGLTGTLYGGDARYRLRQEAVLGLGGVAMLAALGHTQLRTFHMNEGHSALLTLALLQRARNATTLADAQAMGDVTDEAVRAVKQQCVFTTHTPVPAGHDKFPLALAHEIIDPLFFSGLAQRHCFVDDTLNMTFLALYFSRYINGVAMRHREISQGMFPHYPINSITNGVHARTWIAPPLAALFDRLIPEWRRDNLYLRHAISIPLTEIQRAHHEAKQQLLADIAARSQHTLDPHAFTLGFARRATAYKRANLLFTDLPRLRQIARDHGPLQIIYAGKAHPHDDEGKRLIREIFDVAATLRDEVRVVYIADYDFAFARLLCAGVDCWLNTPHKPLEASGTSGMKAAMNGVPSVSVPDGWWIEGLIEHVTGWSIGEDYREESHAQSESESLYDKLTRVILPTFYQSPDAYTAIRRSCIALNGSFFNTQRMVQQYMDNAYRL